jgi:hypothetical protein
MGQAPADGFPKVNYRKSLILSLLLARWSGRPTLALFSTHGRVSRKERLWTS